MDSSSEEGKPIFRDGKDAFYSPEKLGPNYIEEAEISDCYKELGSPKWTVAERNKASKKKSENREVGNSKDTSTGTKKNHRVDKGENRNIKIASQLPSRKGKRKKNKLRNCRSYKRIRAGKNKERKNKRQSNYKN